MSHKGSGSGKVVLTEQQVRYLQLFQTMLGVPAIDVVEDPEENRLIFVVSPGNLGVAVGRDGAKLKAMRRLLWRDLKKEIEVVEYSADPEEFIRNLLSPARVSSIRIIERGQSRIAIVKVPEEDKSVAIGAGGRRIRRARLMAKRWMGIDNVKIA